MGRGLGGGGVRVTADFARRGNEVPPLPTAREQYDVGAFNLFFLGLNSAPLEDDEGGEGDSPREDSAALNDDRRGRGPTGLVGFAHE